MSIEETSSGPSPDLHLLGALHALARAGIRWAHLRGDLDASGGDVDIVVHPSDAARVCPVLEGAGFVERRAPEHAPHRLFVRYDADTARWLVLDVISSIPLGRVAGPQLGIVPALLERSTVNALGLPEISADDRYWLQLLRRGPQEGVAGSYGPLEMVRTDGPVALEIDRWAGPGASPALLAAVESSDPVEFTQWLVQFDQRLRTVQRRSLLTDRAGTWVRSRFAVRAGGRRGLTVAVLGPDGAGKSTLVQTLRGRVPLAVSVEYLGVFRTSDREQQLRRVPGVALARRLVQLRTKSLRASYGVRRGRLVLYDRHVVDALLRPGRRTFRSQVSYALLARSCPPPDLFVVLDAPGEVMFERKREHTIEVLEERRHRYRALADRYPRVAIVDATQPADHVAAEVEELIWRLYSGVQV